MSQQHIYTWGKRQEGYGEIGGGYGGAVGKEGKEEMAKEEVKGREPMLCLFSRVHVFGKPQGGGREQTREEQQKAHRNGRLSPFQENVVTECQKENTYMSGKGEKCK